MDKIEAKDEIWKAVFEAAKGYDVDNVVATMLSAAITVVATTEEMTEDKARVGLRS